MAEARFDWTPAAVDTLTRMYGAGDPHSLIARVLGTTRNACIGKAHRLGLTGKTVKVPPPKPARVRPEPTAPRLVREEKPLAPVDRSRRGHLTASCVADRIEQRACAESRPVSSEEAFADRTGSLGIMDLRPSMCRWPLGASPFRFCGCRTVPGSSYCAEHRDISIGRGTPAERRADDITEARKAA